MNFYLINPYFEFITEMEDAGITGNLCTYESWEPDYFTRIARDIDVHKKIKYMVAIRPHVLSPEYLIKITKSIKEISKVDRLQINLVSGHINFEDHEIDRTLGTITNKSTRQERSNYLIEYINLLNKLPQEENPDYYVSITNDFVFRTALRHNNKMIIPYPIYIENKYDLDYSKVMIYLTPVLRKTQKELESLSGYNLEKTTDKMFTYEAMTNLVNKLKYQGIQQIMFGFRNMEDIKANIGFIKEYNYKN